MDNLTNNSSPASSDVLAKTDQLLKDIQNAKQAFSAVTDPIIAKAKDSAKLLASANPAQDLHAIEEETAAALDEAVLGYVEDMDLDGEDFSGLSD